MSQEVANDTFRTGQRWMPCRNMSKMTAPPFALMRLRNYYQYGVPTESSYSVTGKSAGQADTPEFPFPLGYNPDEDDRASMDLSAEVVDGYGVGIGRYYGQVNIEGTAVWEVLIPDAESESSQNADFLVCNGPQPITSGGFGICTQDWPARVLHYMPTEATDEDDSDYANGAYVGPHNGSWCAWNRPDLDDNAFVVMSHDPTWPDADATSYAKMTEEPTPRVHTMWIRAEKGYWYPYSSGIGGSPHDAGDVIPVTSAPFSSPVGVTDAHIRGITISGGGYLVSRSGAYLFGFQATPSSDTAPSGSKLGLKLYIDSTATSYEAYRLQDIEWDTSSSASPILYTAENVACTGVVYLTAGQTLYVRNSSQYAVEVGGFSFWVAGLNAR